VIILIPVREAKEKGVEVTTNKDKEDMLVQKLSQNAYTAKDLAIELDISIPGAHRKLMNLVERGIVSRTEIDGIIHYYVDNKKG